MTILALDCGTKAGWAVVRPPYRLFPTLIERRTGIPVPQPESGVMDFSRYRKHGDRFHHFSDWLVLKIMEVDPTDIVYEAPLNHKDHASSNASQLANGWRAIVLMHCARFEIPAWHANNGAVKSMALDRKRPPKGEAKSWMMQAGKALGWTFRTDDECDAQWIATYAANCFALATAKAGTDEEIQQE